MSLTFNYTGVVLGSSDALLDLFEVQLQMFPLGDWHCPNCTCKFCRAVVKDVTQTVGTNTCKMCEKKCTSFVFPLP